MDLFPVILNFSISLLMFYTGISCAPGKLRRCINKEHLFPLIYLTLLNYIIIPFSVFLFIILFPISEPLQLTLVTMAALPCAPMVPALTRLCGEKSEWSLIAFLWFSLTGVPVFVGLLILYKLLFPSISGFNSDIITSFGNYFLVVYAPIALGLFFSIFIFKYRLLISYIAQRLAIIGIAISVILFISLHHQQFAVVSASDIIIMLTFQSFCFLLSRSIGNTADRSYATRTLVTTIRNFPLGLAFANFVFIEPIAFTYIVIFSLLDLSCFVPIIYFSSRRRFGAVRNELHR